GSFEVFVFFFSSRRRHTRFSRDWSSDVCSSDLAPNDLCRITGDIQTTKAFLEQLSQFDHLFLLQETFPYKILMEINHDSLRPYIPIHGKTFIITTPHMGQIRSRKSDFPLFELFYMITYKACTATFYHHKKLILWMKMPIRIEIQLFQLLDHKGVGLGDGGFL